MAAVDIHRLSRIRGILFVLGVFAVFLQAGLYAGHQRSFVTLQKSQQLYPGSTISVTDHPIPKLMAQAEDMFRSMLERQSKTLSQAVREYKKRYGRDPPRGFDEWFALAKERNSLIIDDYDAIIEDLSPFFELSGEELRRRVDQVCCCTSTLLERFYTIA